LNPSSEHQFGDVAQAHVESVVEPHAPTDDLQWEPVAFVEHWPGRPLGHAESEQTANVLTMPDPSLPVYRVRLRTEIVANAFGPTLRDVLAACQRSLQET